MTQDYIASNEGVISKWWAVKDVEVSGSGLMSRYCLRICLERLRKTTKTSVRIALTTVKIRIHVLYESTQSLCRVVITRASYLKRPEFKPRFGHRLSWLSFLQFSSVPPGKFRNSTINYVTTASFRILSNSLFTYYTFIRRYAIRVTEKASLNKLQTNKREHT
jgi:hypothetical protein